MPLFLVGLLVTAALEAGLLGALDGRIDGTERGFTGGVEQFTLRLVDVSHVRATVVLVALPFVVVTADTSLGDALGRTVDLATDGGEYARFGFAHLLAGALASLVLSVLVRNGRIPGILLGAAVVALPAVFVAAYGLFVFRGLGGGDSASEGGYGVES